MLEPGVCVIHQRESDFGVPLGASRAWLHCSAWPEPTCVAVKHQNGSRRVPLAPEKDLL